MLERVQRRATKLVPKLRNMSYENRLKAVNLPSLVYRRYKGDMIEVFKYLDGSYSLPGDSVLKWLHLDYKLSKRHCHSQLRLKFFSYRVVNLWNYPPVEVVSAPTLNSFKGRLGQMTIASFLWTLTRLWLLKLNILKCKTVSFGRNINKKVYLLSTWYPVRKT